MLHIPVSLVDHVINLACTTQAIPAPTFHEEQRADFFLHYLRNTGLQDVQRDPAGNVLARIPGVPGRRPLIVSAHMDTVHPFETRLTMATENGRITGPGIGDNALGVAAVVGLGEMLAKSAASLPGDLWLAINVGEEGLGDLRGIQAIVDRFGAQPIAYLVVEGMGLGTILHRGLGVERYKISVRTPGGHSWVNYGEPSAIHELSRIVIRLADLSLPKQPCTSLNVGIIHGGTSVNTIAAHAWLELDLRSEDAGTLASLVRQARGIAMSVHKENISVTVERIGKRAAGYIPADHPLVELAIDILSDLGSKSPAAWARICSWKQPACPK
jgi:acetylornithine deacetylase/succinyl-diaminopimelate desuccinylase-like protein